MPYPFSEVGNPKNLVGSKIPAFEGLTPEGKLIHVDHYMGRKLWICLYRYVGCPLCADHLRQLHERMDQIREAGVEVLAVYETPPGRFARNPKLPGLERSQIPLIADPYRIIHALLGAHRSPFALFHPWVWATWLKAALKGVFQGKVDGDLGLLPAHLLISEDGVVRVAHYGRHAADHLSWKQFEEFARRKVALPGVGHSGQSVKRPTREIVISDDLQAPDELTAFNSLRAQPVKVRAGLK